MITAQCPMKTRLKLGNENQPRAGSGKAEQRPAKEGCHERRAAVVIHFPFAHQAHDQSHHQRCDEQADPSDGNGLEDTVWKDQGNCKARPDARYQQNEYNQKTDFTEDATASVASPRASEVASIASPVFSTRVEISSPKRLKKPQMITSKRTSKISGAKISRGFQQKFR